MDDVKKVTHVSVRVAHTEGMVSETRDIYVMLEDGSILIYGPNGTLRVFPGYGDESFIPKRLNNVQVYMAREMHAALTGVRLMAQQTFGVEALQEAGFYNTSFSVALDGDYGTEK